MPASYTDKLRKKKSMFISNITSGIGSTDTVIACESLAGLPTDTAVTLTIDRVNENGERLYSQVERVTGIVSGDNLIDCLRGQDNTTPRAHNAGAVLEDIWDASTWNNTIDWALVQHYQDGTHKGNLLNFNPLGEYVAETTYNTNDVVSYNGASYVAKSETTGNLPTDTNYWWLISAAGLNGATWYYGTGEPDLGTGLNGDFYLDTTTNDIYEKNSGTWSVIANITGETGSVGPQGDPGDEVQLQVSGGYIQWKYTSDVSWTNLIEVATLKGDQGDPGADAPLVDYEYSADGISWHASYTTGDGYLHFSVDGGSTWGDAIFFKGEKGDTGNTGPAGADGTNGADGVGVPAGGTIGQVLKKKSNTDYDTEFGDLVAVSVTTKGDLQTYDSAPARLGVGTNGQLLSANSVQDTGLEWIDPPASSPLTNKGDIYTYDTDNAALPVGTDGQVLVADSNEDTGLKWENASSVAIVHGEVPSGTINDSNTSFTLASTPVSGSVILFQNGIRLKVTEDYTISGSTITFNTAPATGDLLLVDYLTSTGTFATGSTSFIYDETPSGTVNGSNTAFTLAHTPVSGTLMLYRDGQLLKGGGADYTISGTDITFVTAPATSSVLSSFYQSSISTAGNADTLDALHGSDVELEGALVSYYKGWTKLNESFVYASSNTITIASGGASRFQKGDKLRLKQGAGYKYYSIILVADTLLTVTGGTDYTVANASITDIYVSREDNPFGFPPTFNFTPSFTNTGMTVTLNGQIDAVFWVKGNRCYVHLGRLQFTTGGSADNKVLLNLPLTASVSNSCWAGSSIYDSGYLGGMFTESTTTTVQIQKYNSANWGVGSSKYFGGDFNYLLA